MASSNNKFPNSPFGLWSLQFQQFELDFHFTWFHPERVSENSLNCFENARSPPASFETKKKFRNLHKPRQSVLEASERQSSSGHCNGEANCFICLFVYLFKMCYLAERAPSRSCSLPCSATPRAFDPGDLMEDAGRTIFNWIILSGFAFKTWPIPRTMKANWWEIDREVTRLCIRKLRTSFSDARVTAKLLPLAS